MKNFFAIARLSAVACIAGLLSSGCMSTIAHVGVHNPFPAEGIYPGTQAEAREIHDETHPVCGPCIPLVLFFCVDFPATLALDTVLLPIDALRAPRNAKDPASDEVRERFEEEHARIEREAAERARKEKQ